MVDERFRTPDRPGIRRRWKLHVGHAGGQPSQHVHRRIDRPGNVRIEVVVERLARNAEPQLRGRRLQRPGVVDGRHVRGRRIEIVVAGDDVHHQRDILDALAHRTDMIERPRQRHDAARADAPVRRLQPDDAAVSGRHADGPGGIGPERRVAEVRGDRDSRSASARDVVQSPRVVHRAVRGRVDEPP